MTTSGCPFWQDYLAGVFSVVFLEAIVLVVVFVVRYLKNQSQKGSRSKTEQDSLQGLLNEDDDDDDDDNSQSDIEIEMSPRPSAAGPLASSDFTLGYVIDGNDFEQQWAAATAVDEFSVAKTPLMEENEVEERFASQYRVYCKAAGCQNQLQKYYFYARHTASSTIFLIELILDHTKYDRPLKATIRCHNADLLSVFSTYLQAAVSITFS